MATALVRAWHPVWCNTARCTGSGEHVSEGFTLDGDVPMVVEVFQGTGDATPQVSILQRGDISSVIALPLLAVTPLADVLQHIATGVRAGSRLDPPGTGRTVPDDPRDYEAFVSRSARRAG
jgi:hypothetical protein